PKPPPEPSEKAAKQPIVRDPDTRAQSGGTRHRMTLRGGDTLLVTCEAPAGDGAAESPPPAKEKSAGDDETPATRKVSRQEVPGAAPDADAAPRLSAVSPDPVPIRDGEQTLLVRGSHLTPVANVAVSSTGSARVLEPQQIEVLDAGALRVTFDTGGETGNWAVQVTREDGKRSNVFRFDVAAPRPEPASGAMLAPRVEPPPASKSAVVPAESEKPDEAGKNPADPSDESGAQPPAPSESGKPKAEEPTESATSESDTSAPAVEAKAAAESGEAGEQAEPEPRPATAPATPVSSSAPAAAAGELVWPVRGRIISGFGPTPNGRHNDGINIAVPERTPVRAAADGEVIYIGNEVGGFGNLILIRHEGDLVTAYAHTSEFKVAKGEKVRKGQPIALSGSTGNVEMPQLHFEVRRGVTAVDPVEHLSA
ncbi:MAG: peptidoglycan DD-metalloendopeptidase family protein, partial [Alphaproteobacteria bacterium]